jgi:hypothetical protein
VSINDRIGHRGLVVVATQAIPFVYFSPCFSRHISGKPCNVVDRILRL